MRRILQSGQRHLTLHSLRPHDRMRPRVIGEKVNFTRKREFRAISRAIRNAGDDVNVREAGSRRLFSGRH